MTSRALPTVLLAALAGCGLDEGPSDAQLLVPDDVELHWDPAFDGIDDGLGALVPIDLMVYHPVSGDPLHAVRIRVDSPEAGAVVLAADELVFYEPEDCHDCAGTWDAYRDQYFELAVDEVGGPLYLETDVDGLAQAYVFVDAFSPSVAAADTWSPVGVTVTMEYGGETVEHSFALVPR